MISKFSTGHEVNITDESDLNKLDDIKTYLDKTVKIHRDILILSMLAERSMCGYDLIKNILKQFNVLMSPGAIYPMLYSLEEEGLIKAEYERGNMRTKIYSLTPEGLLAADNGTKNLTVALTMILKIIQETHDVQICDKRNGKHH